MTLNSATARGGASVVSTSILKFAGDLGKWCSEEPSTDLECLSKVIQTDREQVAAPAKRYSGGNRPASTRICRCSTRSGMLIRRTSMVTRPMDDFARKSGPSQSKCSNQSSRRGLKSG